MSARNPNGIPPGSFGPRARRAGIMVPISTHRRVLGGEGEVGDCGLTGSQPVGADEGHGDLHRRPPGHRTTIADASDDGRARDVLPQGLADGFLQLLGLVRGELLVDVDDEALVDLVDQLVVTGEHLDVAVRGQGGAALGHVLLHDCATRHCVVDGLEVAVDRLRGDFLA